MAATESCTFVKKPGAHFNAYNDLFSIRKQDSESLVDMGVRIEKAMQAIQNLQPLDFTIEQLDEELQCMALVRALPDEYRHLSSTLLLVDKLDKAMILQAFKSEELNRQRYAESVNKARAFGKWSTNIGDVLCYYCKKKGHTTHNCPPLKAKLEKEKKADGAKKAEGEKAAAVTDICWSGKVLLMIMKLMSHLLTTSHG